MHISQMGGRRGNGALAGLTFTDRCNKISLPATGVTPRERERLEQGCSVQFACVRHRIQPSGEAAVSCLVGL